MPRYWMLQCCGLAHRKCGSADIITQHDLCNTDYQVLEYERMAEARTHLACRAPQSGRHDCSGIKGSGVGCASIRSTTARAWSVKGRANDQLT